jgi:DNA polymerase III alpha subunit (gram-positive type)
MSEYQDFIVFDLETGGLNPVTDAIVSVCAIVLDGDTLKETYRYYTIVKDLPEKRVTEDALKINKLTQEEIDSGEPIENVLSVLRALFVNRVPVAHNAEFDAKFLNLRGFDIKEATDTMLIARYRWAGASARLGDVCTRLGISSDGAHNAEADVSMTCELVRKYKEWNPDSILPRQIRFR